MPPAPPLPARGRGIAYASQVSRLSSRAQRSTEWCAADPGPRYPGIGKKHGRDTWLPALATLGRDDNKETAPYSIAARRGEVAQVAPPRRRRHVMTRSRHRVSPESPIGQTADTKWLKFRQNSKTGRRKWVP